MGVNQGTDGSVGGTTSFSDANTLLLEAFGGSGGDKGVVSCGCPGVGNAQSQTCSGSIEGASGVDGGVINYDSPLTAPSLPSYIPSDYLTPIVDCCANAGLPGSGSSGNGCTVISNSDNNYPKFEQGAQAGSDGEVGFCAISY